MVAAFRLIARVGPKVEKARFATLDEALADLERRLGAPGRRGDVRVLGREYAPAEQIAARFELHGPRGLSGGVDVRGDGSAEAYRGRIRKAPVARDDGETAVDALRRALAR